MPFVIPSGQAQGTVTTTILAATMVTTIIAPSVTTTVTG